ncbi:MAG: heavy-metal-associated domain-containing protein [Flavobacteriales bacterium]|nr:heavy-metal-associated domain-containing protein [Flavobacteriales bacterium]MEB2342058.1 heavy-metal-associated domain-containing protein [Flavobacteriia bacterium]
MKKPLPLLSILLMVACSHGPSAEQAATTVANRTVEEVVITTGEPMATADLTIGGMSCSMMCAGMIKGALAKVPGVSEAVVDYKDGDELGHAKVTYDPAKVDDAQLVGAVRALADGQYTVPAIAITKQVKQAPTSGVKTGGKDDGPTASLLPEVRMPNLVAMLMALVRI